MALTLILCSCLLLFLTTLPSNTIWVWLYAAAAAEFSTDFQKHQAWDHSPSSGGIRLTGVCWHESLTAPKWTSRRRQSFPMRRQGIHSINRTKVPAPFFRPFRDDAGQYTFQGAIWTGKHQRDGLCGPSRCAQSPTWKWMWNVNIWKQRHLHRIDSSPQVIHRSSYLGGCASLLAEISLWSLHVAS